MNLRVKLLFDTNFPPAELITCQVVNHTSIKLIITARLNNSAYISLNLFI